MKTALATLLLLVACKAEDKIDAGALTEYDMTVIECVDRKLATYRAVGLLLAFAATRSSV